MTVTARYWYEANRWRKLAQSATTPPIRAALLERARDCERAAADLDAQALLPPDTQA